MKNSQIKVLNAKHAIRLHKQTGVIFKLDGNGVWQQLDSKQLFKLI